MNDIAKQIVDIFSKDKSYFENREWCAFYNKYNEECLCFKDSWNFQVSNLVDKDLTDNRAVNCEKLKPFYEWFGERIELTLNLVKGKTNEQLKEELTHPIESEGVNEIEQLKAENARLKEEIKEVKKYQYEQEFLEKEIEEQREKNKRLTCKILEVKALNETLNVQCTSQDCTQLRKLHQTLQEIKAIAEKLMADNLCNNCDGIGLDANCQDTGCPYYQMDAILQKITKVESEG